MTRGVRRHRLRHPIRAVRRWWRHRPPTEGGLLMLSVGIVLVGVAVIILAAH